MLGGVRARDTIDQNERPPETYSTATSAASRRSQAPAARRVAADTGRDGAHTAGPAVPERTA